MANWLKRLFTKAVPDGGGMKAAQEPEPPVRQRPAASAACVAVRDWFSPTVADTNGLALFGSIPEVFFPIDYIASRVASAGFVLKRAADDSVVWDCAPFNAMLDRPNCLYGFSYLAYMHMVHKLATGNGYFRAAVPDAFAGSGLPIYKRCRNYWTLPPGSVAVEPFRSASLYGNQQLSDIIRCYRLSVGLRGGECISPEHVMHDRDGMELRAGSLKSASRLASHARNIDNLVAVYEARNLIYTKQGGLGWIVSAKQDDLGTGVLTKEEKEAIRESYSETYGLGRDQMPYGISDVPISFIRTNLSIQDLQPFEETLADAVQIAGAYGVPPELVPRKDQSTFSNKATSEKAVYNAMVIPLARRFAHELTTFLGYNRDGLYIDVDFHHVDCLQDGLRELEDVHRLRSDRAWAEFCRGLVTLNDVRARIDESRVDNPLFDKLLFEMTPEEREEVRAVVAVAGAKETGNQNKNGNEQ